MEALGAALELRRYHLRRRRRHRRRQWLTVRSRQVSTKSGRPHPDNQDRGRRGRREIQSPTGTTGETEMMLWPERVTYFNDL